MNYRNLIFLFIVGTVFAKSELMPVSFKQSVDSKSTSKVETNRAYNTKNLVLAACGFNYRADESIDRTFQKICDNPRDCASWAVSDYWKAIYNSGNGIIVPAVQNNTLDQDFIYCRASYDPHYAFYIKRTCQWEIMRQLSLYEHDNFWQVMTVFPDYQNLLIHVWQNIKKNPKLRQQLTPKTYRRIESECNGIVAYRQQTKLQEHERQQQSLKQKEIQQTFQQQLPSLKNEKAHWNQLKEIAQAYGLSSEPYLPKRWEAVEKILKGCLNYRNQGYFLNDDLIGLLIGAECELDPYKNIYGNDLQHALHQENIDMLSKVATISPLSPLFDYKKTLVQFSDSARAYNQVGECHKASAVMDFCWSLLDYGSAIVEGATQGVITAAKDVVEHPAQAAICVVAGEYVLAYHLLKVTSQLADIGLTYLLNNEQGAQKWNNYIEPINNIIHDIKKKKITLRDGIKGATALGVGIYAQGKLLKGLSSIYKTAKTKATEFAQKNPLVSPVEYMATPEGILFRVPEEKTKNFGLNDLRKNLHDSINREKIFPKVKTYEQARNKALEVIGQVDPTTGKAYIGKIGVGKEKIVGRGWHDGKVTLRLDFDHSKGPHINITDFRLGKGAKGNAVAIPFEGDETTVKQLLKHLQDKKV